MRSILAFVSTISVLAASAVHLSPATAIERIVVNDNRAPGGELRDGVLTIRLEAREGEWHPDGESAPGLIIRAFAEKGKRLTIPGPMTPDWRENGGRMPMVSGMPIDRMSPM